MEDEGDSFEVDNPDVFNDSAVEALLNDTWFLDFDTSKRLDSSSVSDDSFAAAVDGAGIISYIINDC